LTGVVDENGNRFATWTYDNGRHPTSSQHAGGADAFSFANSITDAGGTVTVTNALGKQMVNRFSRSQSKVKLSGVDELASANTPATSISITYDANGYVASRTDENGNITLYQNDARGLVLSKTEAAGTPQQRLTTFTWLPNFHLPAQIVEPGRTISFTYDTNGNLLSKTETDTTTATVPYSTNGRTRSFSYSYTATGQVASVTGPRGNTISFGYDASGTLVSVTNALGQVTQVTSHDTSGRPQSMVDANGVTTTLAYDPRGRLTTATTAGAITTIAYDAAGNVIRITSPDGSFLAYSYDAAHRLVRVSDAFDERIDYTLDAMGDRTLEQVSTSGGAAVAKTQSRVFDELGRLLQSIGAANQTTHYAYDNDGNLTQLTDPLSNVTGRSFDALNRLIQGAAPLSSTTAYGYDAHDNRTSVTDPRGLVTSYVYDGLDNLIQVTSPDTGTTVYVIDDAGNRVEATDAAGHIVQMSYDALNRLTGKIFPNDPTENITYTYDEAAAGFGIGRLTSVTDEAGSMAYVYDARGNVVQETRVIDLTSYVTAYAYDLANHVTQITYPSGRIVNYAREAMGRISDVTTQANSAALPVVVASGAAYAPFGPLTSLSYGNGLGLSVTYDQDYRPQSRLVTGTAVVQDLSYGVDADGDITGITDVLASTRSQTFQYDALQRLTFASGLYGALAYGYDAVGNRTSQSGGTTNLAETYSYAANSNQLQSVINGTATRSFAYSATGNVASDSRSGTGLSFEYGEDDRPDQVASPVQVLAMYDHDFLGRRVMKDATATTKKQHKINKHPKKNAPPSVITHFLYDRSDRLLAEPDAGTGAIGTEHIWLGDMPVAMTSSGTLYFVHPDHLGTPQKITDATQAIAFDLVLRPFGQAEQQTFPSLTNLRFPGQYFDAESGLHQNWFRDYDPSIGRYIQSDPIGLRGGLNTYAYVGGNTIVRADRTGESPLLVLGIAVFLVYVFSPQPANAPGPCDAVHPEQPLAPLMAALTAAAAVGS
jgi:RHS repeat-associated protein